MKKLFAILLPTISLTTIAPAIVAPLVTKSISQSNKLIAKNKAASINDVTVTFTTEGVDEQGHTLNGISMFGDMTQTIRKNKEFLMLKTPTATLKDAEFVDWQYKIGAGSWTKATPTTKISDNMTIRPRFNILACNKVFYIDYTSGTKYIPLNIESLCGSGNIISEDGTDLGPRATFDKDVYIGQKVTAIPDNFMSGCTAFTKQIVFDGAHNLTYIGQNFMADCEAWTNSTTSGAQPLLFADDCQLKCIDDGFMSNCSSFASKIALPTTITKIGNEFMFGCEAFNNNNEEFVIPTSLTTIGNSFMEDCKVFAQNLTIPANLQHIGSSFMFDCPAMDGKTITINVDSVNDVFDLSDETLALSEQPGTWNGITIAGAQKIGFVKLFPNSESNPFRKLNAAA